MPQGRAVVGTLLAASSSIGKGCQMSQRRIKIILIFFTLAVVVIFTFALLCMDAAPPKDGDLRPARLDVPDEENAFSFLAEAARRFSTADGMEYNWEQMPEDFPDGKIPWNSDIALLVLGKNAGVLKLAEKALRCRFTQAPGAEVDLAFKMRYVYLLLRVRGDLLCRQGNYSQGFDSFFKALRVAHLVETSGLGPYRIIIRWWKVRALEHMADILASADLDHKTLEDYIAILSANRMTDDQFIRELQMDYASLSRDVDALRDPQTLWGLRHVFYELHYVPFTSYHYQPNRTKTGLAAIFRNTIKNLPKDCTKLPRRSGFEDITRYSTCNSTLDMIPPLFKRNAIGGIYYAPAAGQISDAIWARQEGNLRISAMQILMALKCHKRDSGQLPRSLGELVPAHLRAIPADDYDGKPRRYWPEKKMIYSVGEDLTDDGGSADTDIVFRIEF